MDGGVLSGGLDRGRKPPGPRRRCWPWCRLPAWALLPLLALLALLAPAGGRAEPVEPPASTAEQLARCGPTVTPPPGAARDLRLSFTDLVPFASEILARHDIRARIDRADRQLRLELHLGQVRDLRAPEGNPATLYLPGQTAERALRDPRSRLSPLSQVDEATVKAADLAYDIRQPEASGAGGLSLDTTPLLRDLPDYRLAALHTDAYTGFAAAVLEARPESGLAPHRIYAVAGTHVFEHRDFRGWASGLTFGRAQFSSNAALRLVRDAADYARGGGEVVLTGQSQGGLTAQGLGFLLQAYLDAGGGPHHLVHVVSWGGVGAQETLERVVRDAKAGEARGFSAALERHWAATEDDYATVSEVWSTLGRVWAGLSPDAVPGHVAATMRRMRVVGYFFEIDLFARAGTFPGTLLAFPTALILPDACDLTVAEALIGYGGGRFGVRLESHFLKGYRRAVGRGAIAVARPALPAKWAWVTDTLPLFERLGYLWLETLSFNAASASPDWWRQCQAAPRWMTPANLSCRQSWWPGCGPAPDELRWCLVREAPQGRPPPLLP